LAKKQLGEYQSGQLGRTVNPLTYVFTGSNPVSPTKCELQNILLLLHSISKAGVAQLVERQPSKLQVAGSSLVSRSMLLISRANVTSRRSSGVEYFLGKEGVTGSIPVVGSETLKD
jgi:hypothetical protein